MAETAEQYIERILGHVKNQDPMKVQVETAKALERLVKGAPTARLHERPAPDKWNVSEILAHLADAEIVVSWRVRSILGAPGTAIQAFDQNAWVSAGHYERRDPHKSLEQFRTLREANIALYESLTPEQWKHYGMHAERGKETVEHILRLIAGHDVNHVKQVQRILTPET